MISSVEALGLPAAKLSPSDAEASKQCLAELEAYVREHMTRVGCIMPIDPTKMNPHIAAEIERACRAAGWRAEFQKTVVASALQPGQKIAGFQLALMPTDAAYEEADKKAREVTDN